MPAVSIVIPSFRQPQFLERAISSCVEQDFFDLEVIVVDDLSLDDSRAVAAAIAAHEPRVRIVARSVNGGLGRARNTGLAAADGDYIMFLDSDDYLLPGAVKRLHSVIANCERDDVVGAYGEWLHVPEHVDQPTSIRAPRTDLPELSRENFTGANLFICSAPMTRKTALLEVGGFPENLPMLEDFVTWVRIIAAGGVFVPGGAMVCTYRQRPQSMLRGVGPAMPVIADAIQNWWTDRGETIATSGELESWRAGHRPQPHRRHSWSARSSYVGPGATTSGTSQTPTLAWAQVDDETAELRNGAALALDRSEADLADALDGAAELTRVDGVIRRRSPRVHDHYELVLFPTSIETALEALAAQDALENQGKRVAIAIRDPMDVSNVWPVLESDFDVVHLPDVDRDDQHVLVMTSTCETSAWLRAARPEWRLAMRCGGVGSFRCRSMTRPWTSDDGTLLVRSQLEATQYSDVLPAIVSSGVRFGLEGLGLVAQPGEDVAVYLPESLLNFPAAEAWISTVAHAVADHGRQCRLVGPESVRREFEEFRISPVNVGALAGAETVVTVLDDISSLLDIFGVRPVYFMPHLDEGSWSRPWLDTQSIAQTPAQLVEMLGSSSQTDDDRRVEWLRDLGDINPSQENFEAWASALHSSLESFL